MEQDRLLKQDEAAEFLGVTPRFLEMRRFRGDPPAVVRFSSRCVRYRLSDLEAFVERHRSSMRPEEAA